MISISTITDLKNEIVKLDVAIVHCSDDNGIVKPWMKYRLSELVDLKESFIKCVKWLEAEIGIEPEPMTTLSDRT